MTTTDPRPTTAAAVSADRPNAPTDGRGRDGDGYAPRVEVPRETKPSVMTSELWLLLAGIAALVIVYNVADDPSLDLFRTCLLATILGGAYAVSRGLAKSGSRDWPSESKRR